MSKILSPSSSLGTTLSPFSTPSDTTLGPVQLKVANLGKEILFYEKVLGMKLKGQESQIAVLGTENLDLLILQEEPLGTNKEKSLGLYHFALLLPSEKELARALARLYAIEYSHHPTDHLMTMTTYLWDPEGNGIELYCDTPERGQFSFQNGSFKAETAQGAAHSGREVLDVGSLMTLLSSGDSINQGLPEETKMGHIHFHVDSIPKAMEFYQDVLGFQFKGWDQKMGMAFLAAGDYHHHLGFNTWKPGATAPSPETLGLGYFSLNYAQGATLEKVVHRLQLGGNKVLEEPNGYWVDDPFGNTILLRSP